MTRRRLCCWANSRLFQCFYVSIFIDILVLPLFVAQSLSVPQTISTSTAEARSSSRTDDMYDVVVLGGGVVGLAILREAVLSGYSCALVEKEPDLLTAASGSNSGIACTGVDASPGTLERALIRDAASRVRIFCRDMNIPNRPCGSLVCQWPWDDPQEGCLADVLEESHEAGDTHARRLSAQQVRALEPHLDSSCLGAVHIPGEIVVDPWLYSIALAVHARENGAHIFTNFKVDPLKSSWDGNRWTVVRDIRGEIESNHDEIGDGGEPLPRQLKANLVVNAAGVWADLIQQKMGSNNNNNTATTKISNRSKWKAKPRRGQYRVFLSSNSQKTRIDHPIQPVPTQQTKGIFVFSTLYDHLVVGPTALDQDSRTDTRIDPTVAEQLATHGRRILPELNTEDAYVGDYVGIRPGTDQRDYQIHVDYHQRWIAAAGIRSTGLTASLGIGRYVVDLFRGALPTPNEPLSSSPTRKKIRTTPLPPLQELVEDYHRRGDETVEIHGHAYRVTHPITRFGWTARTGMASKSAQLGM